MRPARRLEQSRPRPNSGLPPREALATLFGGSRPHTPSPPRIPSPPAGWRTAVQAAAQAAEHAAGVATTLNQIKEEYRRGPTGNPPNIVHLARELGEIPEIPTIPRPVEPLRPLTPNELRNLREPSPSDVEYIPRRAVMMEVPDYHHQGYDMRNFRQKLADFAKLAVTLPAEFRHMRIDDLIDLDI